MTSFFSCTNVSKPEGQCRACIDSAEKGILPTASDCVHSHYCIAPGKMKAFIQWLEEGGLDSTD